MTYPTYNLRTRSNSVPKVPSKLRFEIRKSPISPSPTDKDKLRNILKNSPTSPKKNPNNLAFQQAELQILTGLSGQSWNVVDLSGTKDAKKELQVTSLPQLDAKTTLNGGDGKKSVLSGGAATTTSPSSPNSCKTTPAPAFEHKRVGRGRGKGRFMP